MAQNFDDFGIFGTVFYQRKNELRAAELLFSSRRFSFFSSSRISGSGAGCSRGMAAGAVFFRLFGLMSKNSRTGMANSSTGIKYCVMDNNRFNTASHFLV